MASSAMKSGPRRTRRKGKHRRPAKTAYTKAGPVTVTRSDGTSETLAAYTPDELAAVTKTRHAISAALRHKILKRDRGHCRYCLTYANPPELDHVIPVAHGGHTTMRNLVTACHDCNQQKGARRWTPKPLSALSNPGNGADPPTSGTTTREHGTRSEHKGAAKQPST